MNGNQFSHSSAWITFTYANALASVTLVLGGIFFLPLDLWIKGYLVMGVAMLISSVTILTKTMRDVTESGKLVNKIDEARTERLLASLKE